MHVFLREYSLNNSVVLVSSDDYNWKREQISYVKRWVYPNFKYTLWQGAMKVL